MAAPQSPRLGFFDSATPPPAPPAFTPDTPENKAARHAGKQGRQTRLKTRPPDTPESKAQASRKGRQPGPILLRLHDGLSRSQAPPSLLTLDSRKRAGAKQASTARRPILSVGDKPDRVETRRQGTPRSPIKHDVKHAPQPAPQHRVKIRVRISKIRVRILKTRVGIYLFIVPSRQNMPGPRIALARKPANAHLNPPPPLPSPAQRRRASRERPGSGVCACVCAGLRAFRCVVSCRVCVCVCARARARACVRACACVCARVREMPQTGMSWKARFQPTHGPLPDFLKSKPDLFRITADLKKKMVRHPPRPPPRIRRPATACPL